MWFRDLPAAAAELDLSAAPEAPMPRSLEPMMAERHDQPFDRDDWLFEVKWDGIRALSFVEDGNVRLQTRRGNDCTAQYPELQHIPWELGARQAIVDGEIVAYVERGVPSFHLLQQRMNLQHETDIKRAQAEIPVGYQVFDLLYLDGRDLRKLPLVQRKALLKRIVQPKGFVLYSEHVEGQGKAFYDAVVAQGLEGVVAKRCSSPYQAGRRTKDWLKLKTTNELDCVIGGWTEGSGNRAKSLGSLALGLYRDRKLVYVTNAGSGFDERTLAQVCSLLEPIAMDKRPFATRPDAPGMYHWVEPKYVCTIKYSNWTPDGHLRHPVFLGIRPDKAPEDCTWDSELPAGFAAPALP
ncbi:MAG: non-homologous end-joining DNA ligase [Chloroflexi bacterium]|nr:non-homologous end-joining DNA ligase [Chloroflexota bacterium]